MEVTGKVVGVACEPISGKFVLNLEVNETDKLKADYDRLAKLDKVDIKIVRHTEKRSLDANSYFHVLVGKIADVMTISKAKAKNMMITRYGQVEMIGSEILCYKTNCPESVMWENESIHAIPIAYDGKATFYKIYRGSHTYNKEEMKCLIDGTVAEAKDLGIETATPQELERMNQLWQEKQNQSS